MKTTRTRRPLGQEQARSNAPTATGNCVCGVGPTLIATFRAERLADIAYWHLRAEGCGLPVEHVDPVEWMRQPARRRRR